MSLSDLGNTQYAPPFLVRAEGSQQYVRPRYKHIHAFVKLSKKENKRVGKYMRKNNFKFFTAYTPRQEKFSRKHSSSVL